MDISNPQRFLDDCWKIIRARGTEMSFEAAKARVGWGLNDAGALCYKDSLILIVAEKAPSKRILIEKIQNHNPVCCTDKDGQTFRWHGEYVHLLAHVRQLAADLDEEPA